ncbi:glycine-rich domain-containing protein [Litchfieldia salsa]|uniref:Uncharacterized protein n=1 Tax=Litchfieldia salsa TaxID=930152 RepID=A0A1H0Q5I5_9BACI|nr:hypothetical protein [Litchfieldia salsa]SDP12305.1 hypothetical protein SAMN05216565_101599 [Litchfieldia salsa]
MFEFIIAIGLFLFIVLIVTKNIKPSRSRRRQLKNEPPPGSLGISIDGQEMIQALDRALTNSYVENVKNRVLLENHKLQDYEFEWTLFELKRYFIMNSLLKSVPMFSTRVDEIWHEMLMFTRDYEKFSKSFYKEILHHTPNLESTPIPGERAFFDWVYLSLFELTSNSKEIWGGFLQNPIKRQILDDFKHLPEKDLLSKYFRKNEDWLDVKKHLITKMKNEIKQADYVKDGDRPLGTPNSMGGPQLYNYALGAVVFYSIYEEEQFQDHMSELMPGEYNKEPHGTGSACSGYACSSSSDDSGGDSGGSSCSSCGGGCSS